MSSELDLVDQIYECAFVPERWPTVLDQLARIADARGGHLFTANGSILNWTASDTFAAGMERLTGGDWVRRGERFVRLVASRHAGFLTELDLYAEGELDRDPFYRDFLWPAGLGWGAGFSVPLPTGDTVCLSLERPRTRGPVEPEIVQRLDLLRPHLARSALMSARMQLERAQTISQTLARIGLAALVLDDRGKVLAANSLIDGLQAHIRWRPMDRVALKDPAANALFQQAAASLGADGGGPARSFALRDNEANAAMVAHLVPLRGDARDVFARCAGLLVLTPLTRPEAPPIDLIRSLFDLSPAEARVARHLASGSTVDEIASADHVSRNTVRTQLRGVLEKTGCRRQSDVVAMLGGVGLPLG